MYVKIILFTKGTHSPASTVVIIIKALMAADLTSQPDAVSRAASMETPSFWLYVFPTNEGPLVVIVDLSP